ncbi:MAG: Glycyl-tRNA synthetase class II [Candidatus Methanohalarchaeum thermophilum]|uniref:glycine--tRNA ligase n=1 Tax=Methanohalarchaeum thermophilum TaxID=1903181 RepID=A0A1Q6DTH8_METT1|nr:MAG: Glycyl-tRNA synthetase class II [Candidatus Methanohalarchaeum thermophilum]
MTDIYDKITEISKRRGFFWPSFDIYGSASGFYDYGPLGTKLIKNIKSKWRDYYINKESFDEIISTTIMSEDVFRASGHLDGFEDAMTECNNCNKSFRADHLVEDFTEEQADSLSNQKIYELIKENEVSCPACGGELGEVYNFNLMFKTSIGPGTGRNGYLRPETAQGMFVDFPYLQDTNRGKLPFGVVQIGRAYRNEISPRQGVIRLREFLQMEAEVFVKPGEKNHPSFSKVKDEKVKLYSIDQQEEKEGKPQKIKLEEALKSGLIGSEILAYYIGLTKKFLLDLGIDQSKLRFRQHLDEERAHYAEDCWDAEAKSDRFGWIELAGISDRTNYDLKKHGKNSNQDLRAFDKYKEPKKIEKKVISPNMDKLGPKFKDKSKKIAESLKDIRPEKMEKLLDKEKFEIEIDGEKFKLDDRYVEVEKKIEKRSGERFYPHVIEPSYGLDRITYITIEHSYDEDVLDEEKRKVIRFNKIVSPIDVAVFPLIEDKKLLNKSQKVIDSLDNELNTVYDESGSIGRRYRRQDEIGTPYCITIDHQTIEDNTVTIRERDSTDQIRVKISDINTTINKLTKNKVKFNELTSSPT